MVGAIVSVLACLAANEFPGHLAAGSKYRADVWTVEQGLPSNFTKAITQTPDGYLWITTNGGLVRFDGVRFTPFQSNTFTALKSDRYTSYALMVDREGALWASLLRHGVMRYHHGVVTAYDHQSGLPKGNVHRIDQDAGGRVWFYTPEGVAVWENNRFVRPDARWATGEQVRGDEGKLTAQLTEDRIFFGFWQLSESYLRVFRRGRETSIALEDLGIHDSSQVLRLVSVLEDSNGNLILTRRGDGTIHYLVDKAGRVERIAKLFGEQEFLVQHRDRTGRLLVQTRDGSLYLWQQGHAARVEGFSSLSPVKVFEDRDGVLWLGTANRGIARIRPSAITMYNSNRDLAQLIRAAVVDPQGVLWFGGDRSLVQAKSDGWIEYRADRVPGEPLPRAVRCLMADRDGTIWIGTSLGLLWVHNGRLERVPHLSKRFDSAIQTFFRDSRGDLWIAAVGRLLRVRRGQSFNQAEEVRSGMLSVRAMTETAQGQLWFVTTSAIWYRQNDQYLRLSVPPALGNGEFVSISQDSSGVLWVGTNERGLLRIRIHNGVPQVTHLTMESGLQNNSAYTIAEDVEGSLWVSCRRGLYRLRPKDVDAFVEGQIKRIPTTHFDNEEMTQLSFMEPVGGPHVARTPAGQLLYATAGGVAEFDPGRLLSQQRPPLVLIEDCHLNRASVPCRDELRFGPVAADLEIQYTGLSFIRAAQIQFRYRMHGFDPDWIEAGTRRTAYYSHLPSGDYRFEVMAANADGVWQQKPAVLQIHVAPHIYETWWFLTAGGLAFSGLLYLAHERRLKRLRVANALQDRFARQLIDLQENERKRIAAELHDSLGQNLLIIGNLATLGLKHIDSQATARQYLEEISESAAHSLSEVRQIAADLRPQHLDRLGLKEAIEAMVERAAKSSSTDFDWAVSGVEGWFAPADAITFYRIIQELVSNILKHARARHAEIRIQAGPSELLVRIIDDGIGFDPAAQAEGLGLPGIAERTKILNGDLRIESTTGEGTTVTIMFPKGAGASHAG